jgi:hypothetical protein
MQRENNAS